jgi:hypothetical protein
MAILIILASVAIPLIGFLTGRNNNGGGIIEPTYIPYVRDGMEKVYYASSIRYPGPIYGDKGESITIDGITIYSDNPFYWNLQSLVNEKTAYEKDKNPFSSPAALDLFLGLIDEEIKYYLVFAQHITTYQDYRIELAWRGVESLYDKFFFEHNDVDAKILEEVAMFRKGLDPESFRRKYIDITATERLMGIDKADDEITMLRNIVVNNDFPQYIAMRIAMANTDIANLEETSPSSKRRSSRTRPRKSSSTRSSRICAADQQHPDQHDPDPRYRLAKNIIPGLNIWQNNALSDVETAATS